MKKQSIAIIGVVAFVLAVAIGYALFSDTITITGTATAKGNFDMEILPVETTNVKSAGYTKQAETADIAVLSDDKDTLTITINKLDYPGAYVEIPVKVKNVGSIPAKLKNVTQTGMENDILKVTYTGPGMSDAVVEPGTFAKDITIRAEWDSEDTSNTKDVSTTFTVTLEYEQITVTQ